jgi:hypothetical protein
MRPKAISHLALALVALATVGAANARVGEASRPCGNRLLATIETDGKVSFGSINDLRMQAASGERLYVGWEIARQGEPPIVRHWQDARFITLFENIVFVQVGGWRQDPQIDKGIIELPAGQWISLLSSDGQLLTRMTDRPEPIRIRVRSHWCLAD